MKRLLPALFLCAACGAGMVDHSGVDLSTLSCPTLQENCGGVCVATDSNPDNCGGCGIACAPRTLASRTCAARACGFTCNPGFFVCADQNGCCPASALAAGGDTTCALVDTKVQCWGSNDSGQLGTPGGPGARWSATPVVVPGLPAANSVAVGGHHACAILAGTGEVWCWGANSAGQLGDNTTTPHGAQKVSGITGATSLALGGVHSCALTPNGVFCWGSNNSGQLGDGTITDAHVPPTTPVLLPATPSSIAAGTAFTCAVVSTSVYCWGDNDFGQIPGFSYTYSKDPVHVLNLSNVTSVGLGAAHGCAIGSGFWCWGEDSFGQVGDGKMQASSSISGVNGVSAPAAAVAGGLAHTCAIDSGFNAFCWGANSSGQLGTGGPGLGPELRPVHVLGLSSIQRLALGATHSCALTADRIVYCWGNNGSGQAGAKLSGPTGGTTVLAPRAVYPY